MSHSDSRPQLIIFGIISGVGLMLNGLKRFRMTRKIQDTPRTTIAAAPQGQVEILGYCWPTAELVTNISGHSSIFRRIKIEELVNSGKSSSWREVFSTEHPSTFAVVDHSGVALVDTENADFDCITGTMTKHWKDIDSVNQQTFLELAGGTVSGLGESGFFSAKFRVVEQSLLVGSPVYLIGNFTTRAQTEYLTSAGDLGQFLKSVARIEQNPNETLQKFNFDKNDVIDADEMRMGVGYYANQAINSFPTAEQPVGGRYAVAGRLMSVDESKLFFADCHQDQLLKSVGGLNTLRIIGGALLLAASMGFAYSQFFSDSF